MLKGAKAGCGHAGRAGESRTLRTTPAFEEVAFARQAVADDVEEGAYPRRALEVGMGDDPEFAFEVAYRLGQGPCDAGLAIAEVTGQKRQRLVLQP